MYFPVLMIGRACIKASIMESGRAIVSFFTCSSFTRRPARATQNGHCDGCD